VSFKLFNSLDKAIIDDEMSAPRASRTPAVWPSEASAIRVDRTSFPVVGTCARKVIYRMIGWLKKIDPSAAGSWKWIIGKAIENKVTDLAKYQSVDAGIVEIYVAHGVRLFIAELYLPLEIDVVVKDPDTNRGYVLEVKSYAGYVPEKQIERDRRPKEENLLQICLYLMETRTGKHLKELIAASLQERAALDTAGRTHRNRCEANLEALAKMDDGPIGCKLVYINRDTAARTEMDIEIFEDADGFHYPMVDGTPYKIFTIESIYDRFRMEQNYWFRMRQEAADRLEKKGIKPPPTVQLVLNRGDASSSYTEERKLTPEEKVAEDKYYKLLEDEVRSLPEEFFPPPEYEWSYSPERINELAAAGVISKTKMKAYQAKTKKGEPVRLGDWQCSYCQYAKMGCIAKQKPDLAYLQYDFSQLGDDDDVKLGE